MSVFLKVIRHNRAALFGSVMLALFFLTAVFGPICAPLDLMPDFPHRFMPPGAQHLLGTDYAGRDVLVQLIHGSRDIMLIAFSTGLFGVLIALAVGLSAGLIGGWYDAWLTGLIDVFLTVPSFPVMAIFAVLFRIQNPVQFGLVLAIWQWPGLARAIRAQVLAYKHREFVEVCRIMAMSPLNVIVNELIPNMMPFVSINFIGIARNAITASVGIMLLGLVPLRVENWGMMLNMAAFQSGAIYVPHAWSYLLSPMFAIVLFQYSLVQFASGVDELFDPRLRSR
ncbi:MAG: ABC transporter permease [Candidatus Xenobia bacterium]